MIKIFNYLTRQNWFFIAIISCFIVVQVWLDLKLPEYLADITQLVQGSAHSLHELWEPALYMMLCAVGSALAAVIVGYFVAHTASSFAARLRELVFHKVSAFSMNELNQFSTASLITRSTNDITQIQTLVVTGLQILLKSPLLATWAIIKIADKSWQWTTTTAIAVVLLISLITFIIVLVMPKFKLVQVLTDNLNKVTRENLIGMRVIRAYNAEAPQQAKFNAVNEQLTAVNLFTTRAMTVMMPVISLMMSGLTLAIYWIGAYLIDEAQAAIRLQLFTDMIIFSSYAMQVVMSFMMLSMVFIVMPRAAVSAKRIMEVLQAKISILDGSNEAEDSREVAGQEQQQGQEHEKREVIVKGRDYIDEAERRLDDRDARDNKVKEKQDTEVPRASAGAGIQFRNVSFKYPDAGDYVLRNISFTAKKGETVAIIGATGSGKTTLVNLIPRLYDATDGQVLVDGVDVKQMSLHELHHKIGYVSQKPVLFSGTVAANIAFGEQEPSNSNTDQMQNALEIAQAKDFVDKLEHKQQAAVAQGGSNLSGGQKQRLAIARAIYRQPDIYIFDDSFSALDYRTDRQLRQRLKQETANSIKIIVAQRITTIKDADLILVLEKGELVGTGTYEQLLHSCGVFQEIAYSQLTKEEVAHA